MLVLFMEKRSQIFSLFSWFTDLNFCCICSWLVFLVTVSITRYNTNVREHSSFGSNSSGAWSISFYATSQSWFLAESTALFSLGITGWFKVNGKKIMRLSSFDALRLYKETLVINILSLFGHALLEFKLLVMKNSLTKLFTFIVKIF